MIAARFDSLQMYTVVGRTIAAKVPSARTIRASDGTSKAATVSRLARVSTRRIYTAFTTAIFPSFTPAWRIRSIQGRPALDVIDLPVQKAVKPNLQPDLFPPYRNVPFDHDSYEVVPMSASPIKVRDKCASCPVRG